MSVLIGIQAAATAYYEQTGRRLVSMTVAPEEWPWLLSEARGRCNILIGSKGSDIVEVDGVLVAMQERPIAFTGKVTL